MDLNREQFEQQFPCDALAHFSEDIGIYETCCASDSPTGKWCTEQNQRWIGWKASRAVPVVLPNYCCELCGSMRDSCAKAIESAGYAVA